MANSLAVAFDLDQPAALVEISTDSGATYADLPVPAAGTHKTGTLLGVPAGTYAAGVLKLRAKGFPASVVSNTAAVTVVAATAQPAPTISGASPNSGAVGTAVTVTGTAFTGATLVSFNDTAATFTVLSATQINTTVPAGATTGPVLVRTPGGTGTSSGVFTVTAAVGAQAPIGVFFSRPTFADLTGLLLSSGAAVTAANQILTTAGQPGKVVRTMASGLSQFDSTIVYTLQANDPTNYGFIHRLESLNTAAPLNSLNFYVYALPGAADFGKLVISDDKSGVSRLGPFVPGFAVGAELTTRVQKTKTGYVFSASANGGALASMNVPRLFGIDGNAEISNATFQFVLGGSYSTGQVLLKSWTIGSDLLKNAKTAIGDSITDGFSAGTPADRYAEKAGLQIVAGPADRTTELLLRMPELLQIVSPAKVFMMIGTNQPGDAAYKADLTNIKNQLAAAAIPVVFLPPPARVGADTSGYRDYLMATYPGAVIDTYAATKSSTSTELNPAFSADGTHPNGPGHAAMANAILTSPIY